MPKYNYKKLMCIQRERQSTVSRASVIDEFYSDRSRIIYCSAFRRLQQKAQVFSLESNSSVRTRLTHSIEVSDLGRTIANNIGKRLLNQKIISVRSVPYIVSIVENACPFLFWCRPERRRPASCCGECDIPSVYRLSRRSPAT